MATTVTSEDYGKTEDGRSVLRFTLTNSKGVIVRILNFGATVSDIVVPDKNGKMTDVSLGFDNVKDYEFKFPWVGAICGRVANRIAGGQFTLDGKTYNLFLNNGPNSHHGGEIGFDKKVWSAETKDDKLVLTYTSPDGEENYPGDLTVSVTYSLDQDNSLKIEYHATTTKATLCNLTSHAYFNLAGHECGHVNDHVVTMYADSYLPLDENGVPTGEIRKVSGSEYDLLSPVRLGDCINSVPGGKGFDINYCYGRTGEMKLAARVEHKATGRYLECYTTQPGVQLYTAYYLDKMTGKNGVNYGPYGGLCLEGQHYPDSIHQPEFPTVVLRPGETYSHSTIYKFGLLS